MTADRRTTPDPAWVDGTTPARIAVPLVDLCDTPDGTRDRQLLLGTPVTVLGARKGYSYIRNTRDGYIGWVASTALTAPADPTHQVTAPATHAYTSANIKSPDRASLSFGALVTALSQTPDFIETALGFVPRQHLAAPGPLTDDPAAIAALFLGTPYLWGGNSRAGIDCSGLVQAALHATGHACPADSDQQAATLGTTLPPDTAPRRNDLLFWKGHVALVTDPATIIHANAHAMATTYEPLDAALARIARTDGPLTAHKRL